MKFILALALIGSASSAIAEEYCDQFAILGRGIMATRQMGTPLDEALKTFTAGEDADAPISKAVRAAVLAAYEVPQWGTPDNKKRAITEYGNDLMLVCLRSTPEK